ncbi:hypothetical protein GCM10009863_32330 [Streptomyces axinellae]|uniref:Uncharacterized protein n=1 Tax=Streptomyces axinellae TaxID=552788 RepID=A0ABP6CK76_9ACTN
MVSSLIPSAWQAPTRVETPVLADRALGRLPQTPSGVGPHPGDPIRGPTRGPTQLPPGYTSSAPPKKPQAQAPLPAFARPMFPERNI